MIGSAIIGVSQPSGTGLITRRDREYPDSLTAGFHQGERITGGAVSRTRQQAEFVSPEFFRAIRCKFLHYVQMYCGNALDLLVTDVLLGRMTAQEWADRYDVGGTWVQDWANQAIRSWKAGKFVGGKGRYLPPMPEVRATGADKFRFYIPPTIPPSKEAPAKMYTLGSKPAHGIPLARAVFDDNLTDWDNFCNEKMMELKTALRQHRENQFRVERVSREVIIPPDLDLYLQEAAVYYFGTMTTQQISEHPGTSRDPATISRHLKLVLDLLDLPPRPKGHRPRKPQTK